MWWKVVPVIDGNTNLTSSWLYFPCNTLGMIQKMILKWMNGTIVKYRMSVNEWKVKYMVGNSSVCGFSRWGRLRSISSFIYVLWNHYCCYSSSASCVDMCRHDSLRVSSGEPGFLWRSRLVCSWMSHNYSRLRVSPVRKLYSEKNLCTQHIW